MTRSSLKVTSSSFITSSSFSFSLRSSFSSSVRSLSLDYFSESFDNARSSSLLLLSTLSSSCEIRQLELSSLFLSRTRSSSRSISLWRMFSSQRLSLWTSLSLDFFQNTSDCWSSLVLHFLYSSSSLFLCSFAYSSLSLATASSSSFIFLLSYSFCLTTRVHYCFSLSLILSKRVLTFWKNDPSQGQSKLCLRDNSLQNMCSQLACCSSKCSIYCLYCRSTYETVFISSMDSNRILPSSIQDCASLSLSRAIVFSSCSDRTVRTSEALAFSKTLTFSSRDRISSCDRCQSQLNAGMVSPYLYLEKLSLFESDSQFYSCTTTFDFQTSCCFSSWIQRIDSVSLVPSTAFSCSRCLFSSSCLALSCANWSVLGLSARVCFLSLLSLRMRLNSSYLSFSFLLMFKCYVAQLICSQQVNLLFMSKAEFTYQFINKAYDQSVIPTLFEYIKIPSASQNYDSAWNQNGLLLRTSQLIRDWVIQQKIPGLTCEIIKDQDKSPLIFTQLPGPDPPVLIYGHFDKQPPMTGWHQWTGPYSPVIRDGRLYGRGGADDGYSTFSAVLMIKCLLAQGNKLPRMVILTEGNEQSNMTHLMAYLQKLGPRIGTPSLCFCLDSGSLDYERLWVTTSLRGAVITDLTVSVLKQGIHSGDGSGICANPFRIASMLISRIQDKDSGDVVEDFQEQPPPARYRQHCLAIQAMGHRIVEELLDPSFGVTHMGSSVFQAVFNRTLRAQLSVVGVSGLPKAEVAGNAISPNITLRLSLRLPPTLDAVKAGKVLKQKLEESPPYNSKVEAKMLGEMQGWSASPFQEDLLRDLEQASQLYFCRPMMFMHEGFSVPLMGVLSRNFPKSQLIVTGVLGPNSNAHGPNQFLDIEYAKKITCCMCLILEKAALR